MGKEREYSFRIIIFVLVIKWNRCLKSLLPLCLLLCLHFLTLPFLSSISVVPFPSEQTGESNSQQQKALTPWPLISNLGSSAGLLRVAETVDLTSTPTATPGHWQLSFVYHNIHWAWEKKRGEEGWKKQLQNQVPLNSSKILYKYQSPIFKTTLLTVQVKVLMLPEIDLLFRTILLDCR